MCFKKSGKRLLFPKIETPFSYCLEIKMFYLRTGDLLARKDLETLSSLVYPGTKASSKKCLFLPKDF